MVVAASPEVGVCVCVYVYTRAQGQAITYTAKTNAAYGVFVGVERLKK